MDQEVINFTIQHLDGFGQGVSTNNGITFIEKALPGEQGTAVLYRKAKGVRFARVLTISVTSSLRKDAVCPFFNLCGGCQYLHVLYEHEVSFKKAALENAFRNFSHVLPAIQIVPARNRLGYRNRVQLHYNRETGELGYVSKFSSSLIPADKCLLPTLAVAHTLQKLYRDNYWESIIPHQSPVSGTIEIYDHGKTDEAAVSVNTLYAQGGFSQVNQTMNDILVSRITAAHSRYFPSKEAVTVLDVFGGNGNLTVNFPGADVVILDREPADLHKQSANRTRTFLSHNLYKKNAVGELYEKLRTTHYESPRLLVFDPPRKGIQDIEIWMRLFSSEFIFYISCNPATLRRDTALILHSYTMEQVALIDLFPATRHFETFAIFKKIEYNNY